MVITILKHMLITIAPETSRDALSLYYRRIFTDLLLI